MQIDGEYFSVVAPKKVKIESTKDIKNGKVKILVNKDKTKS